MKNKKIAITGAAILGGVLCLSCLTGCNQNTNTPDNQLQQSVSNLETSVAKLNLIKDSDLPVNAGVQSMGTSSTGTTSGMNSTTNSGISGTSGMSALSGTTTGTGSTGSSYGSNTTGSNMGTGTAGSSYMSNYYNNYNISGTGANTLTTGGMPTQNSSERLMSAHSALRNAKFMLQSEMLRTEELTEELKNGRIALNSDSQNLVDEYSVLLNRISTENRRNTKDYNQKGNMLRSTDSSTAANTSSSAKIDSLIFTINSNLVALDASINALRQINLELTNNMTTGSMNTNNNTTTGTGSTTGTTSNGTTGTGISTLASPYSTSTQGSTLNSGYNTNSSLNRTSGTNTSGSGVTGMSSTTGTGTSNGSTMSSGSTNYGVSAGTRTTPNTLGTSSYSSSNRYYNNRMGSGSNTYGTGSSVSANANVDEQNNPMTLQTA